MVLSADLRWIIVMVVAATMTSSNVSRRPTLAPTPCMARAGTKHAWPGLTSVAKRFASAYIYCT